MSVPIVPQLAEDCLYEWYRKRSRMFDGLGIVERAHAFEEEAISRGMEQALQLKAIEDEDMREAKRLENAQRAEAEEHAMQMDQDKMAQVLSELGELHLTQEQRQEFEDIMLCRHLPTPQPQALSPELAADILDLLPSQARQQYLDDRQVMLQNFQEHRTLFEQSLTRGCDALLPSGRRQSPAIHLFTDRPR